MGNFSRSTFDRLKHYVAVRLQQGVPVLDADWNEEEDIRRFEVRTFLRWFVGDGVPAGNDGFRISTSSAADDFAIAAGRCLVDGWDAVNDWDQGGSAAGRFYRSQRLFNNPSLATAWGVAPLPALTVPGAPRTDRVYLDVWEREVAAAEDAAIVHPSIGIETATRRRCEWVVRVAEGAGALPAPPAGHAFHELATLSRPAGGGAITAGQITARRRTGLTAISWPDVQQITADALGTGYTLDGDGAPNLSLPLRQVVNDLLRGQYPGTPATQVAQGLTVMTLPRLLADRTGAVWMFYRASRGGVWDLRCNRWNPVTRAWGADVWLTASPEEDSNPVPVEGQDGTLWLFFSRGASPETWYRRYDPATGAWGPETRLLTGPVGGPVSPVVDSVGDLWVFFPMRWNSTIWSVGHIRWTRGSNSWGSASAVTTSSDVNARAVVDTGGDVWVFFERHTAISVTETRVDIYAMRWVKSTGSWAPQIQVTSDVREDRSPTPVAGPGGTVWVFWHGGGASGDDVYARRWEGGAWGPETVLGAVQGSNWVYDAAVGLDGDVWSLQVSWPPASLAGDIWLTRYTREAGWGKALLLSQGAGDSAWGTMAISPQGDLWVGWFSYSNNGSLWVRRLAPGV